MCVASSESFLLPQMFSSVFLTIHIARSFCLLGSFYAEVFQGVYAGDEVVLKIFLSISEQLLR